MYTVGTKVRINCPKLDGGVFHGRIGKVTERNHSGSGKLPYIIELKINGHIEVCPFFSNELVRINKKRKT